MITITLPAPMVRQRSRKISVSGLVGYLKLTCRNLMCPFTFFSIFPDLQLESIADGWSRIANIEAAQLLALLASGAKEPE